MILPRLLGFIALVTLLSAAVLGRQALLRDPGLRKAIAALLFCSAAGLATSFTRAPVVIWPLGLAMLAAMVFLVWTMHAESRRKERT
jgi:hypothetical protein